MPFLSDNSCPLTIFSATNTKSVLQSLHDVFNTAGSGWTVTNVPAFGVGTFASNPSAGNEVMIGTVLYKFVSSISGTTDGQVLIGGTTNQSLLNLADAINANPATLGTAYSSDTVVNPDVTAVNVTSNVLTVNAIATGGDGNYIRVSGIATWAWGSSVPASIYIHDKLLFGGWKFRYRSAQRLIVIVYVYDNGTTYFSGGSVRVQVQSGISSLKGFEHSLEVPSPTGQLQALVSGGCFYISNPSMEDRAAFGRQGMSVCGGLLQITSSGADDMPTEAWWSSGDGVGSPFFIAENPRLNLYTNVFPNLGYTSEGVWSGTRVGDISTDNPALMRILPKNAANGEMITRIMWAGTVETPIIYDALVAWGDSATGTHYPVIRGSIPDARISSLPEPIETTVTDSDGSTWINYTHNYIKGGLWLRYNATPTTQPDRNALAQYRKPLFMGTRP